MYINLSEQLVLINMVRNVFVGSVVVVAAALAVKLCYPQRAAVQSTRIRAQAFDQQAPRQAQDCR